MIVRKMLEPSRDDAVRLCRTERQGVLILAYLSSVFGDFKKELASRLEMVEDGPARMKDLEDRADALLNDIRMTIPMNQRLNIQNTVDDYEFRIVPKATPRKTTVVMQLEEFRSLVDSARERCKGCIDDCDSCQKCDLFQLLSVVLPVDDAGGLLCPYNLGEWKN